MTNFYSFDFLLEDNTNINFIYSYDSQSTFNDLLEYIAYLKPNLNICPCYKFQYKENYYSYFSNKFSDINMKDKIANYANKNTSYKILKKYRKCNCIYKNYLNKTKIEIIDYYENKLNTKKQIITDKDNNINSLGTQITNLNNRINELIRDKRTLESKNSELIKEKKSLELKNSELNKRNGALEKENSLRNEENKNLKKDIIKKDTDISKLQSGLEEKKRENALLNQAKKNLEENINKVSSKINSLDDKNAIAKKEINNLKIQINEQNLQKLNYNKTIEELTAEKMKLMEEKIRTEKSNKDTNFIDFYDVIVDIKSIKDITKGWQIKMNENGKTNYEKYKKEEVIKIGVIGNANKGKSFLLSKISKIDLPSGTSIRTEGLSIKYPSLEGYENRKIVLLDSAGLETPVLKEENEKENESKMKDENKNETGEEIKIETKNGEEKKSDLNNEENIEEEYFREKSREKLITELFLQNYIINNSDILIIVVGILTYSEQKLLNRIKTEILKLKKNNKISHKPIYIIHNLITYKTKDQVEEYINDFLLKSATFDLKKGHKIGTTEKEVVGSYYYEKLNQEIFHLIFAHDGSDAGNIYNKFTLDFIEKSYQSVINLKSYDVIETVKNYFINLSKDIFEKTEKPITIDNFENENNLIKLKTANITLKKCLIDELGFSNLKANGFEPTYNYYKKENKIILKIEIPGNHTLTSNIYHLGEFNCIKINGSKNKDKEPKDPKENIDNTREFGKFTINVPLRAEEYPIKNMEPKIDKKMGVIFLEYELEDKSKEVEIKTNEEEEI